MKSFIKMALAVTMLLSVTLSANAQFSQKQNNRETARFHMGIRGGFTLNSLSFDHGDGPDSEIFPTGGIGMDFQIAPVPVFLETGVYYMNKCIKDSYYDDREDDHYPYMPLLASYHFNVAPGLFIQPFTGATFGYLTETEEFESAWRIGCGLNWKRLYFNAGYDLGLTKHESYDNKYKYNTFFVTIGFNWAGDR